MTLFSHWLFWLKNWRFSTNSSKGFIVSLGINWNCSLFFFVKLYPIAINCDFEILKGNSYHAKNDVNGSFLGPKINSFKVFSNLLISSFFSKVVTDNRNISIGKRTCFDFNEWTIFGSKSSKIQKFHKKFS